MEPVGNFTRRSVMRITVLLIITAALLVQGPATVMLRAQEGAAPAASRLDFEYFKTKVQPIFLAKRPGHARCVSCHSAGTPVRLQPLPPGSAMWNDEDSRKNFETFKRAAQPGNLKSMILVHPLAETAGGDFF